MSLLFRSLGLTFLILRGCFTLGLLWPNYSPSQRQASLQRWSSDLLRHLRLTVNLRGQWPCNTNAHLLTSNHVSWTDIFIIQSRYPVRFISKSEVRHWPIFGWLATHTGTLFLDRHSRRQTLTIGQEMISILNQGESIGLFPESTTSAGQDVLPFKTSLLQAPLDCQATLLPVALRYHPPYEKTESAYPFIGEMSFLTSLKRILLSPPSQVTLTVGKPCPSHQLGNDRRILAQRLHAITRELLSATESTP